MKEGWHDEQYVIIFEDQQEAAQMAEAYSFANQLPQYSLVGLLGWDDFVIKDEGNAFFSVPTVPLDSAHIQRITFSVDTSRLVPDERFKKKIKWYIKPLFFGGDPKSPENTTWISMEEHAALVKWWNQMRAELKKTQSSPHTNA